MDTERQSQALGLGGGPRARGTVRMVQARFALPLPTEVIGTKSREALPLLPPFLLFTQVSSVLCRQTCFPSPTPHLPPRPFLSLRVLEAPSPLAPLVPSPPVSSPRTCFLHCSHPGPSARLTVSHTHWVSMSAGLVCEYKQGTVPPAGLCLWKPQFVSLSGAHPPPPLPAIPHPRSQPAPPTSLSTCQCWRSGVTHHPAPLTGRRRSSPLRLFLNSFRCAHGLMTLLASSVCIMTQPGERTIIKITLIEHVCKTYI